MTTTAAYRAPARWFHWSMAVLLACNLALGWYASSLPRSLQQLELFTWHKALGITLLALIVARLAWRLAAPPPPLPTAIPRWQRRLAGLSHAMLYGVMFALPLAGWITNSAANVPLSWFGLFSVPAIAPASPELRTLAGTVHAFLAWSLALLAAVHVLAALKHALVDRDGIFARMWPVRAR